MQNSEKSHRLGIIYNEAVKDMQPPFCCFGLQQEDSHNDLQEKQSMQQPNKADLLPRHI